jgi:PTS system nitrogen regulatory IIA component
MNAEVMDLQQLASYLRRDSREVQKLADRGQLPGRKIAGQWKFSRAEILTWVSTQLPGYSEEQLFNLEDNPVGEAPDRLVGTVLTEASIAVPLQARTRGSVLQQLVAAAERTWQVYDADALLEALKLREEMASTAMDNGVAIPHPRRPLPNALGETVVVFGRTLSGIPYGGPHGALSDLFFLVCCRDDRTHLRVLARIARLCMQPGLLEQLRSADTVEESYRVLEAAERELR